MMSGSGGSKGNKQQKLFLLLIGMVFFTIVLTQRGGSHVVVPVESDAPLARILTSQPTNKMSNGNKVKPVPPLPTKKARRQAATTEPSPAEEETAAPTTDDCPEEVCDLYPPLPATKLQSSLTQFEGITDDKTFKQLHHGIYRVVSTETKVKYALKTECRPAAKWHGQQGWAEVATHHLAKVVFRRLAPRVMVPFARGVVATATKNQIKTTVHSDQCGVVSVESLGVLTQFTNSGFSAAEVEKLNQAKQAAGEDSDQVFLLGVGLVWQDTHDDSAFPLKSVLPYFTPHSDRGHRLPPNNAMVQEEVASISDILVLDYLMANPDREEKNWFTVATGGINGVSRSSSSSVVPKKQRIAMDNGWMFAGSDYVGSVCADMENHLTCPPVFRQLTRSKKCGGAKLCRFRNSTVQTLWELGHKGKEWEARVSSKWIDILAKDPLIHYMLETHATKVEMKKRLPYSTALARYIQGCESHNILTQSSDLLGYLSAGISKRLAKLEGHIQECISQYGGEYVLV